MWASVMASASLHGPRNVRLCHPWLDLASISAAEEGW